MLLGHWIAANENKIKEKLTNPILITIVCMSVVFIGMRRFLPIDIVYLGVITYSFSMFVFALKNSEFVPSKLLERIGEKYSLYVYVTHPLVNLIIGYRISNEWLRPLGILGVSLLIAIVIRETMQGIVRRISRR